MTNPVFTMVAAGGTVTSIVTNQLGTTIICSFTNQYTYSMDIGYLILQIGLSADGNNLESDNHQTFLPFYGNQITLGSVNGSPIIPNTSYVVDEAGLLVSQNASSSDPSIDVSLEKEGTNIEFVELDVWTDRESIKVNDLETQIEGTSTERTVIDTSDPVGEFTYGERVRFSNNSADLSATSVNLGRLGVQSHVLDRNSYRLDLKNIKYFNTPNKTINSVGFNKNSTFEPIYSLYTEFDGATGIVQVKMKKCMLGLYKFIIRIYARNDLSLTPGGIVLPLDANKYAYVESENQGPRGDWIQHKDIKISMIGVNEYLNQHNVLICSFPVVSTSRRSNDMFDVGFEEVRYDFNKFLGPNNVIPLSIKNDVNPEQIPIVYLSDAAYSSGSVITYAVYIYKPSNEAVRGFVINIVYNNTKFTAFGISNWFILESKTAINQSIVGDYTIVVVQYDDPISNSFSNGATNPLFSVQLTAVNIATVSGSDFYIMFESYTPYDTSLSVNVTQFRPTQFTYIPEIPLSTLYTCSLSQNRDILQHQINLLVTDRLLKPVEFVIWYNTTDTLRFDGFSSVSEFTPTVDDNYITDMPSDYTNGLLITYDLSSTYTLNTTVNLGTFWYLINIPSSSVTVFPFKIIDLTRVYQDTPSTTINDDVMIPPSWENTTLHAISQTDLRFSLNGSALFLNVHYLSVTAGTPLIVDILSDSTVFDNSVGFVALRKSTTDQALFWHTDQYIKSGTLINNSNKFNWKFYRNAQTGKYRIFTNYSKQRGQPNGHFITHEPGPDKFRIGDILTPLVSEFDSNFIIPRGFVEDFGSMRVTYKVKDYTPTYTNLQVLNANYGSNTFMYRRVWWNRELIRNTLGLSNDGEFTQFVGRIWVDERGNKFEIMELQTLTEAVSGFEGARYGYYGPFIPDIEMRGIYDVI